MSFKILRKVAKHETTVQIKIKFVLSSIFPMSFFEPANHAMSTLIEPAKETYQSSKKYIKKMMLSQCNSFYICTVSHTTQVHTLQTGTNSLWVDRTALFLIWYDYLINLLFIIHYDSSGVLKKLVGSEKNFTCRRRVDLANF